MYDVIYCKNLSRLKLYIYNKKKIQFLIMNMPFISSREARKCICIWHFYSKNLDILYSRFPHIVSLMKCGLTSISITISPAYRMMNWNTSVHITLLIPPWKKISIVMTQFRELSCLGHNQLHVYHFSRQHDYNLSLILRCIQREKLRHWAHIKLHQLPQVSEWFLSAQFRLCECILQ